MSKIEEALEKANKLRNSSATGNKFGKRELINSVEHGEIDNPYMVTITQPDSPIAEEYRKLKSMLIRETKADFMNTIMITSSVNGEGKSITAINLAVTLAQEIDHSTLLIDADLRKPMIHNYLGIRYEYGLSDYLIHDIDISEILIKTGIGNMVILPAGQTVSNPVELLSSQKMKSLIRELKQRYTDRYIIIDTPPILSCAEGIGIGYYADGIVFVIKEGQAQRKTIENALDMMKRFNILGVVFNDVSISNLDGDYSYNYYRYKKKEKE